MSQIEDAIRDHEERCNENIEKRLVSWKWLITTVASFVVILLTTAWCIASSSSQFKTETKIKLEEHEKRITKIEKVFDNIYEDIKYIRKKLE